MDLQNTTMKNISEKKNFVIILAFFCFFGSNCGAFSRGDGTFQNENSDQSPFEPPRITGALQSRDLNESSGLAASKCQPGIFWTHNDSGGGSFIFAISSEGTHLGVWRVDKAVNNDWEDIASYRDADGLCYLYVGDIGDNARQRESAAIYRIVEPNAAGSAASKVSNAPATEPAEIMRFRYPATSRDSEALLVHPITGDIYVITKRVDGPAEVYKLTPHFDADDPAEAEKIAEIALPAVPNGLVTGGDISQDGKRVVLCDYFAAYLLILKEDTFDSIWREVPTRFDPGERKIGEAIAFDASGTGVLATSEGVGSPVIFTRMR